MGNRRRRLGPSDTHPQQAAVKSFGKLACKDHADQRHDAFKALSPRTAPSPATRGASGPASLSSAVGGGLIHAVRTEARPHTPGRHRKVSSRVAYV